MLASIGKQVKPEMHRNFKVTQRAANDLQEHGKSGLYDLRLKTLIEDVCVEARASESLLPPFETADGQSIDFFVRMEPEKENDLKETMYLLVTKDSYNNHSYAVVAAWSEDYYLRQAQATGLNGGLRHRPIGSNAELASGFSMPKSKPVSFEDEAVARVAPAVHVRPTQASTAEAEFTRMKDLLASVATGLSADYLLFVKNSQGEVLEVHEVRQADDEDGKVKVALIFEDLLDAGHKRKSIVISKLVRAKVHVQVEFE